MSISNAKPRKSPALAAALARTADWLHSVWLQKQAPKPSRKLTRIPVVWTRHILPSCQTTRTCAVCHPERTNRLHMLRLSLPAAHEVGPKQGYESRLFRAFPRLQIQTLRRKIVSYFFPAFFAVVHSHFRAFCHTLAGVLTCIFRGLAG